MAPRQSETGDGEASGPLGDRFDHARPSSVHVKARKDTKVLLLDHLRLTRDCIAESIQELCPDMTIAGLSPVDYLPQALTPDVALIIFNLHGAAISEAARRLRLDEAPASPALLFITHRDHRGETMEAVENGVMGLVRANVRIELLVAAIRLVIAGGSYYPANAITSLVAQGPAAKDLP